MTPFRNRAPARTRGTTWAPAIARQRALGRLHQLEHHGERRGGASGAAGDLGAERDRGERRLDGVRGPYLNPMLDREVVEGEQLVTVVGNLRDGRGPLGAVGLRERLDRLLGAGAVLGVVRTRANVT